MNQKIFIGVAWPYVNGPVHIGHLAGAYLCCDYFARYHRLKGNDVLMVTGSDMHGTPTTVEAEKEGVEPIVIASRYHQEDKKIFKQLGITFDIYTKTSTKNHKQIAQSIFFDLIKKGYIFQKTTKQPYCQNCQRFLPDRYIEGECPYCHFQNARGDQCDECGKTLDSKDLINPKCKLCQNKPIIKKTEHFFFDLPQFEKQLKAWVDKQKHWRNHVKAFTSAWLREGLKPRAVSRDMTYGVPVPVKGFENKVIYVWFEAVIGYLSAAIEWAKGKNQPGAWKDYWHDPKSKHYYFIGKDNIPFHTIIWPAILLGYDKRLQLPYDVPANNFLTLEGKPLSKSRGWFVTAEELIEKFSIDAIRFYFAHNNPETKDLDFSYKNVIQENNSLLVGTIGNFIYRTLAFTNQYFSQRVPDGKLERGVESRIKRAFKDVSVSVERCSFQQAARKILDLAKFGNVFFDKTEPWNKIKSDRHYCAKTIFNNIQIISALKTLIYPFLPLAAAELHQQLGQKSKLKEKGWKFSPVASKTRLGKIRPLFSKIEAL